MNLVKGDVVQFFSKEEREAMYGTDNEGYPRMDMTIDYNNAVLGIRVDPERWNNQAEIMLILKDRIQVDILLFTKDIFYSSIKNIVGHINDFNPELIRYDDEYAEEVFNEVKESVHESFFIRKKPKKHKRSDYSSDVLKIACDLVDEFGNKCITYDKDMYEKFNCLGSCFTYNTNVHFKDHHEESYIFSRKALKDSSNPSDYYDTIERLRFKFGRNRLYAGEAVLCILDILEARYHLDFNKLEEKVQQKAKQKK